VLRILGTFGFTVVNTRESHAKLRRISPTGTRETFTVPLHDELAPATLHGIYRQALRYVSDDDLHRHFFTG
jgi:predicted RNA binding protein YcfA (HicA-like mRNA interferase family)